MSSRLTKGATPAKHSLSDSASLSAALVTVQYLKLGTVVVPPGSLGVGTYPNDLSQPADS